MSVVYVLTTPMPEDGGENPTMDKSGEEPSRTMTIMFAEEELTLIELGSHLRIEESLRVQDSDKLKGNNVAGPSVVNMVEHNNSSRYNDKKGKRKHHDTKVDLNKKLKVTCWKYGKPIHLKRDCKGSNVSNKANGSGTKGSGDGSSNPLKVAINSITESKDAIFDEHRFSLVLRPSQRSLKDRTEDSGGLVVSKRVIEEVVQHPESELRKSKRRTNYFDTYASMPKISTIRLLIAMASTHNLIIHQMDVKTAFLNEELENETPKQWHQKFDEVVLFNGYLLNQADKCVYRKIDGSGKGVIICLYVDDKVIFGTDQVQVDLTKELFSSRFSMKDIGEADVIIGIRIKHESNYIAISQSHHIEKVLKKFNYSNCTLVSTSLDTYEKLMPNKGPVVSQLEYSRVIGCLMYVMTYTRPDIAFAIVAGKEAEWLENLLFEIPLWVVAPISIRCDSVATLSKAYIQMYNGKSRHLGVRHSIIRELIMNGMVSIEFVRS
nr:zinc finger, CCHC-type [Tanacetum cinerariifolium]